MPKKLVEIDLTDESWNFINSLMAEGPYRNPGEVFAEAVELQKEQRALEQAALESLGIVFRHHASEQVARAINAPKDEDYRHALLPDIRET